MMVKNTFASRHFKCPYCKECFHIKRKCGRTGAWVNNMPPRFCPGCGRYVVVE